MKMNIVKLAELAGVSTSTVSRALKNNPVIKQETRDRIQSLAKQHNFSVNTAGSRLRTQKTNVVGVILNLTDNTAQSISDPFLLKVVGDLNEALNEQGYELLLSNSHMATSDWYNYFIQSSRVDGLIVIGQGKSSVEVDNLAAHNAPLVVWGDPLTQSNYPIVGSNNELGGYLATQHLISGGAKRVLFLGDAEHAEMTQRYKGYQRALTEASLPHDPELVVPIDITSNSAYNKINELIRKQGLFFDAIVATSDMVALGAMKALKERYINIPGEVGIVGFDDIVLAELLHPSLTTIKQDTKTASKLMVQQLLNQFNEQETASQLVDIELIKRSSTRA